MSWQGKKVIVLGLARQGKSLARHFARRGANVAVSDLRTREALSQALEELGDLNLEYVLGSHPMDLLRGADLLCLSAGVPADHPLVREARERGVAVTNDAQLFINYCPAPVIGITGSAGKTTTTALLGRMAQAWVEGAGRKVWVGGNIGNPLLSDLEEIQSRDVVVMELSSFQLELMHCSPAIAAILNITPNHLDRHGTMAAYMRAKQHILDFQTPADSAVLGRDDPVAWGLRDRVAGKLSSFGFDQSFKGEGTFLREGRLWLQAEDGETPVCPREMIELRGEHNLLNVAAACAIGAAAGLPVKAMRQGIRGFKGVEHRLEFVREVDGVIWINDSIATAPERSIAAIRAFDEPLVLLAGGRDKDLPWRDFADLVTRRVEHLVLFGEAAYKIARALEAFKGRDRPQTVTVCSGLDQAVGAATQVARPGDVVLLAPGGTSFDEFKDFAQRGERFRELVSKL